MRGELAAVQPAVAAALHATFATLSQHLHALRVFVCTQCGAAALL